MKPTTTTPSEERCCEEDDDGSELLAGMGGGREAWEGEEDEVGAEEEGGRIRTRMEEGLVGFVVVGLRLEGSMNGEFGSFFSRKGVEIGLFAVMGL